VEITISSRKTEDGLVEIQGKEESYKELVAFLHDWLNDHIVTEDKKLTSFLKDKHIN